MLLPFSYSNTKYTLRLSNESLSDTDYTYYYRQVGIKPFNSDSLNKTIIKYFSYYSNFSEITFFLGEGKRTPVLNEDQFVSQYIKRYYLSKLYFIK